MKFSIVTPTYNSEKYLADTIESVLSQEGDFEVEYIIIDGDSKDNTIDIIKKYAKKYPLRWISEKDNGMYSAINKGFSMASGDIYAYINSDDIYLPNAFQVISKTFKKYPAIHWLKGITEIADEKLNTTKTSPCYIFNQEWIKKGIYGRNAYFIHQDSVFWKKELWNKIGKIDEKFKLAGDYYLWTQFAKHFPLWSINTPVSRFRKRSDQLSEDMTDYRKEQSEIQPEQKDFLTFRVKLFFWLKTKFPTSLELIFFCLYKLLFWGINKYYINIENNEPVKRKVKSYLAL